MRWVGRCARLMLWVIFPPLGWYASARARGARRHRQLVAVRPPAWTPPAHRHPYHTYVGPGVPPGWPGRPPPG